VKTPVNIAPAQGKLGVLLVGLGAVSTTTIAGVIAIRKGLAQPIGSLTQMGTIRLGKRTDGRSPKIKDFVDLARLDDIVFGGWDIFEEDCYAAAGRPVSSRPRSSTRSAPRWKPSSRWPRSSTSATSSD
jgi:myo-inositol-1-phosphate synthase